MGGGETGEGDEVPDGLYSGFRSPDISERVRPGPTTQLWPLHVHGVFLFCLSEGSLILTWAQDKPPSLSDQTSEEDTGEQYFRRVKARHPEAKQTGRASQLVDFRVNMETRV